MLIRSFLHSFLLIPMARTDEDSPHVLYKIPPSLDSLCVLVPRVNGVGGGGHREMGLEG